MKTYTGFFRTKKYGTWQPFEIDVPASELSDNKRISNWIKEQLGAKELSDVKAK